MNISVILGHPNPLSFNHVIAHTAHHVLKGLGHTIFFHDLYAEGFDPNLPFDEFDENAELPADIRNYCKELMSSKGIIVVHPNWWGQPPAIVKGWIDRIFRPGVAYMFAERDKGEGVPIGLLEATAALVFNTSNTPLEREMKVFGDPLETLWRNCIFGLCGIKDFFRKNFGVVITSSYERRKIWLEEVKQAIAHHFS
jgi:NAD(P)H dehydrogenase (quinone)